MLRVGFLFLGNDGWLGGVNYLWNLLHAVVHHEATTLAPVLIVPPGAQLFDLDRLPGIELVHEPLQRETIAEQVARTVERRAFGRDRALARLARRERLDVISHSGTFGWRFEVPTVPWLADLQHRRLPAYFTTTERLRRIYVDLSQLAEGTRSIVSSEAARRDCQRFYGPLARRTDVLHFVSQPRLQRDRMPSTAALRERLGVPARYFFLPNQFWRHKNHAVVVDALAQLARRGVRPAVVLTGKGEDYRAPHHYDALMRRVAAEGLGTQFLHLGLVSYEDLGGLMRDALAVINPSYFEGWSTTVEEARSLGKTTVLSDIDVHREQAPPGAVYFPPDDAGALADALAALWSREPAAEEATRERAADLALVGRTAAFAARYRAILELACRGGQPVGVC